MPDSRLLAVGLVPRLILTCVLHSNDFISSGREARIPRARATRRAMRIAKLSESPRLPSLPSPYGIITRRGDIAGDFALRTSRESDAARRDTAKFARQNR